MKSDERRQAIKRQREQLIQDLEAVYMAAFDRLGELELSLIHISEPTRRS